jgi:hypothetical protein
MRYPFNRLIVGFLPNEKNKPVRLDTQGLISLKMIIHTAIKMLLLGALMSCTQPADSHLNIIKQQIVNDYNEMESAIRDSLEKQDNKNHLGNVIQAFIERRPAIRSKGGCTVAVLDPNMRFIAGRYLGTQDAEIKIIDTALKNYQYLKESFKGLEKGRMTQNILYYKNDKIYVVAKAVQQGQALLGYLFFAYNEERVNKDWKISDEQFMKIDFRRFT